MTQTPPNLQALLDTAKRVQEEIGRVEDELKQKTVEGTAGGGMVVAVANGRQQLTSIRIDPEIVEAARQFVSSLSEDIASPPAVVPMPKGNLQFEWHEGPRTLELEIENPTTIHYLKWHPEEGTEEESFFELSDVFRAESLIRWFMRGVKYV